MARKSSGFTSDERGIECSMAMPEVSHRFCGRPVDGPLNRALYTMLREERIARECYEIRYVRCPAPRTTLGQATKALSKKRPAPAFHVMLNNIPLEVDDEAELDRLADWLEMCTPPSGDHFIDRKIDRLENRVTEEYILSRGICLEQSKQHRHIINSSTIPPAPPERRKTLPIVGRRMQLAFGGMSRKYSKMKAKGFPLNRHLKLYAEDTRWGKRNGKRRDVRRRPTTYPGQTRHIIRVDGRLFVT